MKKVLVICGATASGKTKLAVDCALKFNTEIISADSQLIYKGLNIGTAKPTLEEMRGVKHHMIDIVEPSAEFSVSDYCKTALPIMNKLLNEDKTPIICGGTGFYINSLLFDLGYGNTAPNNFIREKYSKFLEENGKMALLEELNKVDSETAQKLHVNDTRRIIRALEIYESGGIKKSEQQDKLIPKVNYVAVAIDYPREELYGRINSRVDEMFNAGLIEEVKGLLNDGITEKNQCMQAIGYKEIIEGLKNNNLQCTMSDIIKQNTRHYAKRQVTFFKKLPNLVWLKPEEATADKISELLGL